MSPASAVSGRTARRAVVAWRIVDGRRGHENQTRGLLAALAARTPVEVHDVAAAPGTRSLGWWIAARFPPGDRLPDPDLAVGAGHACHLPMLAARRARGARTVVLMRPSLPLAWFDLCLVPRHDRPPARANVAGTEGVLNAIRPAPERPAGEGLILVGGPSRHHRWSTSRVLEQIRVVLDTGTGCRWTVTDSRRTPAQCREALAALGGARFVPVETVDDRWLPGALARSERAWVTVDSVSMIFEALTAGAAVGLITLEADRPDRITESVAGLERAGRVVSFSAWRAGAELVTPAEPLDEAGRCADLLLARWPDLVRPRPATAP